MVKRNSNKTKIIGFEEFETLCKDIAILILDNKNIKEIYGVPRGGCIAATRIAYLTGLPLTFAPKNDSTAIIDDCIDSGATRHSFGNFLHFFPLIDKQADNITEWLIWWWEVDQHDKD